MWLEAKFDTNCQRFTDALYIYLTSEALLEARGVEPLASRVLLVLGCYLQNRQKWRTKKHPLRNHLFCTAEVLTLEDAKASNSDCKKEVGLQVLSMKY